MRARTSASSRKPARTNQRISWRPARPGERSALIRLHGTGRLPDEQDPLLRMAAEHRMRPGDVPGIGASRAGALLALDRVEAFGESLRIAHGERTLTRGGGVAGPQAISSAHRSTTIVASSSGRRGQPSFFEAPCPTSLRAPPGHPVSDGMTAPPSGGPRSSGPIFLTATALPPRTGAGTRSAEPAPADHRGGGHRTRHSPGGVPGSSACSSPLAVAMILLVAFGAGSPDRRARRDDAARGAADPGGDHHAGGRPAESLTSPSPEVSSA